MKIEREMSPEEEQGLRELSEELAGLSKQRQPRIVAETFTRRNGHAFTLTMQGWIDLEFVKSPLLSGGLPETVAELEDALAAFDHEACSPARLEPHQAATIARRMLAAVDSAFSLSIPMKQPNARGTMANDGFGTWLPVYAFLLSDLHMSRMDALECPVGHAFGSIAGRRHNQGWAVAGENYLHREIK